jgi:hypothetical protein
MFFVHSAAQRKNHLPVCRPSAGTRIRIRFGFLIYPNVRVFICPVSGKTLFLEVGRRELLVEPSRTTSDQHEPLRRTDLKGCLQRIEEARMLQVLNGNPRSSRGSKEEVKTARGLTVERMAKLAGVSRASY